MAVSSYDMANVQANFGRGNDMGAYLNTWYYYAPYGGFAYFPANNIGLNVFINTSANNEWACDCNCGMK